MVVVRTTTPEKRQEAVRLYVDEQMGVVAIARQLDITQSKISKWLTEEGIEKRPHGYENAEKRQEAVRLYTEEGLRVKSISERLEVGQSTISVWLTSGGVERRPKGTDPELKRNVVHLYVEEGLGSTAIAARLRIGKTTVINVLEGEGIERRPRSESPKKIQDETGATGTEVQQGESSHSNPAEMRRDMARELYVNRVRIEEIARIMQVEPGEIRAWFMEEASRLHVEEKLGVNEIARRFNRNHGIVSRWLKQVSSKRETDRAPEESRGLTGADLNMGKELQSVLRPLSSEVSGVKAVKVVEETPLDQKLNMLTNLLEMSKFAKEAVAVIVDLNANAMKQSLDEGERSGSDAHKALVAKLLSLCSQLEFGSDALEKQMDGLIEMATALKAGLRRTES